MKSISKASLKSALLALGAVALMAVYSGGEARAQEGKTLFTQKGCPACHGPNGNKPIQPAYPRLAGQNAAYIVNQLKAFKAQERKGGQAALMWGMAAQLNEEQMQKIADWLSKQG